MINLKSIFKFVVATAVSLALLLGLSQLFAGHLNELQSFSAWLDALKPAFIALHVTLIALLWLHWSTVIRWLSRKSWVHPKNLDDVLTQRTRVVAMLCAIEIVMVIGFPFNLLH